MRLKLRATKVIKSTNLINLCLFLSDRQINEPINSTLFIYSHWFKYLILIFNFHPALLLVYIPLTSNENEKLRGLLITIRLINIH